MSYNEKNHSRSRWLGDCIMLLIESYMLSLRNIKTVDLYVNHTVSENRAFMCKSEGLGKLGFYM